MKSRLIYYLAYLNVDQDTFEKKCGLSKGFIRNLTWRISAASLLKIHNTYPDLNLNWLIANEGNMIVSNVNRNEELLDRLERQSEVIGKLKAEIKLLENQFGYGGYDVKQRA